MERFFVNRPIFAISLAVVIVLLGGISIFELSIEQYPDITPPVVEVSASYNGADAETVNDAVATPVAQSVMGVSDMLYMQTTSSNDGSMVLQVTFEVGSDPDLDAIFTQNNVATSTGLLPSSVVTQGVVTQKSMTGFLMVYALYSDGRYDDEFLANYAYINLQNELLKINGVGKVSVMGSGEYAMRIWIKPDLLNYYDVTLDELRAAILSESGIYPAGQFGAEPAPSGTVYTYTVTMPPRIATAEEFAAIVVKTTANGEQIFLRDVADVALGSQSYGMASAFGRQPATLLAIYQEPGSNAVDVGNRVKTTLSRLAERFPDGIACTPIVDSTQSIRAGVKEIILTLVLALVLVIAIIYLFIQDWRATLIPLVAIPVSLVGTFILFPLLGFSINIISLLALVLAIGLVVDDAIVVVEAAQVNIEHGATPRDAAIEAMRNVSSPIVATTVVLLAVFIPMSFVGGISGRLFQQFAVTISAAVVLSAFNALTLSPALCALLLERRDKPRTGFFAAFNRRFEMWQEHYSSRLGVSVRRMARTVSLLLALGVAIAVAWALLPEGFLPEEDQGYVMVTVNAPEASSLRVTEKALQAADTIIRSLPEVQYTSYAAGFNMLAGTSQTDCGVIFVKLVDFSDRKRSAMQIASALNGLLYSELPEAQGYAFIPPSIPGLGVTSGVSAVTQDLEGRGTAYLAAWTERYLDSLRRHPEIASATTSFNAGVPQRKLVIDKAYALQEGVALNDVYTAVATYLGGAYVNNFNRFGRLYQTYMSAAPDYRVDAASLDSYFVESASGNSVPLSAFVSVRDTVGPAYVSQFNLYRSIALNISPAEGVSSGQTMQIVSEAADKVLPPDVGVTWSGTSFIENSESKNSAFVYLLSLAIVFLALAALYESWSLPAAILLGVPPAVLGALGLLWIARLFDPLFVNDIYMQISLVMLIGLSAKNAILVVEYADHLFFEQKLSLADAAVGAARLRVRPIFMTAFSFILGVLPLVFASGVYSTARNIMGIALVGGMLLATLLGIFIYPALYYLIGTWSHFERKRASKLQHP